MPVTEHASISEMLERTAALGIPTTFGNYQSQLPQCGFGMDGVCCQLCSHGPCRVNERMPLGICGINADGIVARNLLRLAAQGASAYSFQLNEGLKTLKAAAAGKTPFRVLDEAKLHDVAGALGIGRTRPAGGLRGAFGGMDDLSSTELAGLLAEFLLRETNKDTDEPLRWFEAMGLAARVAKWKELGVYPGGVNSEIRDAGTRAMTSIDTDPVDLLLASMRLSIANAFLLEAITVVQDILLGAPRLTLTKADLGVLNPKTVNIVAHGHIPWVATAVLQAIRSGKFDAAAQAAGAEGILLYGSMDTGQELLQRLGQDTAGFGGQLGNWLTQELWAATGAVDLVMLDYNCTIPNLKYAAEKFHTVLVPVTKVVRVTGADAALDYDPATVAAQAEELIGRAVESFKQRRADKVHIPAHQTPVVAGFGLETIAGALGGSLAPLIEVLKSGAVQGIAAVVGCTNNRNGHDTQTVTLARELIKRNVLVLSGGCVSSAFQAAGLMTPGAATEAGKSLGAVCRSLGIPPVLNFGSCTDIGRMTLAVTALAKAVGVDSSDLPVVVSAPEYLEQKAVADGFFAVTFGLATHLGPVPPVTGSALVVKILTQDVEGLTGGRVMVEQDPLKAAEAMAQVIQGKRRQLGLADEAVA